MFGKRVRDLIVDTPINKARDWFIENTTNKARLPVWSLISYDQKATFKDHIQLELQSRT